MTGKKANIESQSCKVVSQFALCKRLSQNVSRALAVVLIVIQCVLSTCIAIISEVKCITSTWKENLTNNDLGELSGDLDIRPWGIESC